MITIRLLLVEDNEDDALLLQHVLREGGYDALERRVETAEAFREALSDAGWDLIIADLVMPRFSGLDATRMARALRPDLPVIIVSGKVGEESAVEAMRAGAQDYLLKEQLSRLVPVVRRELQEAEGHREWLRAEGELRQSEARFRALADAMPQLVWTAEPDGRVDYYNSRYREYEGIAPTGDATFEWAPVVHPDDLARTDEAWNRAVQQGEVYQIEHRVRMADGSYRWHLSRGVPARDADGRIVKWYGTATDIHDFRLILEDRERLLDEVKRRVAELDATLNSVADGLIIYGQDGEILQDNPAARRLLDGILLEEEYSGTLPQWVGLHARTPEGARLPADDAPAARATRGETVIGEVLVFRHRDGHETWLSVSAAPICMPDDTIIGVVGTYTDITAMHELQEQQKMLVHLISHDLRAPLTVIKGHVQLLQEVDGLPENEELAAHGLSAIDRGVDRMNAMIQDLVDAARAEGQQLILQREAIDLRACVPEILARNAGVLETERIQLELPEDMPQVDADVNRLERILLNLLSNALKYSDPGMPVRVRVRRRGEMVEVEVADRGHGIDAQDLPHLFERFYRAKSDSRTVEGIGLGLYITRLLVEAHGGQIRVESTRGQGSAFIFTLPVIADAGA